MKSVTVTVKFKEGLHARPAVKFIKLISPMKSRIMIIKGDEEYEAKSIVSLLSACISSQQTIEIRAEGEDEDEVIKAVSDYFQGS